jgi:hypothetical protein
VPILIWPSPAVDLLLPAQLSLKNNAMITPPAPSLFAAVLALYAAALPPSPISAQTPKTTPTTAHTNVSMRFGSP